ETEIYALAAEDDAKREKPLPRYFEMDKRIRYKVKKGDFLGKIANKFGVRINDIKRWNSLKSTRLSIGQRLYIYPRKVSFLLIKQQENKVHKLTTTVVCDCFKIQKRDLNSNIC
ncbi:MAG: LysM peptidoglycan-binding domain-containing protein, partial [Polaribacter sp.]|nr:LysM peptidoglycan-binding domain-containing protein [Polaribacter sp.]